MLPQAEVKELPPLGPWVADARCGDRRIVPDPGIFHPAVQDDRSSADAKKICELCPVIKQCREYALEHYPRGIWGGCTEADLRRIRTYRRRQDRRAEVLPDVTRCPGCGSTRGYVLYGTRRQCIDCTATWVA